jgi:YHS domain-containing protein
MKRLFLLLVALTFFSAGLYSQPAKKVKEYNISSEKLALDGYDPVAYFKQQKAIEGKASISVEIGGIKYRFASTENKATFLSAPETYEPQYGGWCAYAMGAKGEKVEVDPETFKLVDGKLYLFYNRFFNNTLDTWNKNESTLKANADKNWNKILLK